MSIRKKNILDKIGALIPGYSGYAERSDKRKTEKIFRDQNALLLEKSEKNIIEFQKNLLSDNDINMMREWDVIRKRINTMSSIIKYANYGESSFFSTNQIKEEELNQILGYDEQIAERVQIIFKLTQDELNMESSRILISNCIREIDAFFLDRSNFISRYK